MVHWDCVSCPETRCRRTESSPEHLPQGLMLFLSVPSKMLDVIQDFKVATKQFEVCLHLNTMSYFKLYFWKGSNVGTHIPIIPNIWYLLWPIMTNYDQLWPSWEDDEPIKQWINFNRCLLCDLFADGLGHEGPDCRMGLLGLAMRCVWKASVKSKFVKNRTDWKMIEK